MKTWHFHKCNITDVICYNMSFDIIFYPSNCSNWRCSSVKKTKKNSNSSVYSATVEIRK